MEWESWKRFGVLWFAMILPVIFLLIAVMTGAGVLWMFLLLVWICAGMMIAFLPGTSENLDR